MLEQLESAALRLDMFIRSLLAGKKSLTLFICFLFGLYVVFVVRSRSHRVGFQCSGSTTSQPSTAAEKLQLVPQCECRCTVGLSWCWELGSRPGAGYWTLSEELF